jgi:hypothetical protein
VKKTSSLKRTSMYPFSFDLFNGSRYFAEAAISESDRKRKRYYNTAAVIFAAAAIEAVLNEQISIRQKFGPDMKNKHMSEEFFDALFNAQKTISLKDKWNLFTSIQGGTAWDSTREPFQSYDIVITLRNELIHYKAEFLGHYEPPVKKLHSLIKRFHPKTKLETPDELMDWLSCLLESKYLSQWLSKKIRYAEILELVLSKKKT